MLRGRAAGEPDWAAAIGFLPSSRAPTACRRPFELYAEILGAGAGGCAPLATASGAEAEDPIDEFLGPGAGLRAGAVEDLEGFLRWLVGLDDHRVKTRSRRAGTATRCAS